MPAIPVTPNNANTYLAPTVVTPGSLLITNVTRSYPMQVYFTNASSNTYIAGMTIKFTIPPAYGMNQLNNKTGKIVAVDNVSFIMDVDIDSRGFDAFLPEVETVYTGVPQLVNVVDGAFDVLSQIAVPLGSTIAPGTIDFGFAANVYTDPAGDGVLVGDPAGAGAIDYITGEIQVTLYPLGAHQGTLNAISYFPFNELTSIQPASFSPAGSRNLQYSNSTNQVPFQNLNNQGN